MALLTTELIRRSESSARLLKPVEVAELFGYKRSKIYALIDAGVIPAIQLSDGDGDGTLRVPLLGLQAFIVQHIRNAPTIDSEWLSNVLSAKQNGAATGAASD